VNPYLRAATGKTPEATAARIPAFIFCLCVFFLILAAPGGTAPRKRAESVSLNCELCRQFSLYRHGDDSPAVLVVGGIQGDEPGGFSAATLLATRYTVSKGAMWVVPNLNFPSIVRNLRGLHGDMNRKFLRLAANDPEYTTVSRIQGLIRQPGVVLVLNLHDGSGFFRPRHEDALRNPKRWGQCVIIDQSEIPPHLPHSNLESMARKACDDANERLLSPAHRYHIKNTRTADGDREMEKTLSWYAVRHHKAAFGLEVSKELPVEMRAYYQLLVVESFLRQAGVEFARDFELTASGVLAALQSDVRVSFADNRVVLPLEDARPRINFLPLPRGDLKTTASKPILAVVRNDDELFVHYGNRTLTRIRADWRETDDAIDGVDVRVDGIERPVRFGQVLEVRDSFKVMPPPSYRANAIGAKQVNRNSVPHAPDKSGLNIRLSDFRTRFSVDTKGTLYRVEIYRGRVFAGMFLVRFSGKASEPGRGTLPAVDGPQSELGR
jgi:hypothetical protein